MAKKWIKGAIKKKGSLRKTARAAGAMTSEGTIKVSWLRDKCDNGTGKTKKRACLALTLRGLGKG